MKSKLRTLLLQALLEDWSGSTRAKETWYSPSGQVAKLQTLRRDRLDGLDDEVGSLIADRRLDLLVEATHREKDATEAERGGEKKKKKKKKNEFIDKSARKIGSEKGHGG